MLRAKRTSKGKQKIEMKKIENEEARYISFSKRRGGVFGKASELSTLCGADIAVLIFSPTGKLHSYGSPAVDHVVDRFLSGRSSGSCNERAHGRRQQVLQELNQQFMELSRRLEASKAKKAGLRGRLEAALGSTTQGGATGWVDDLEGLGLEELERLRRSLGRLKARADAEIFTASIGVDHGIRRSSQHAGVVPSSGIGWRFWSNSIPPPAVPRAVTAATLNESVVDGKPPRVAADPPVVPRLNSGIETIDFLDINGLFEEI